MQCSCDAMREYEQVAPHQVVYRPISILSGTSDISGAIFLPYHSDIVVCWHDIFSSILQDFLHLLLSRFQT